MVVGPEALSIMKKEKGIVALLKGSRILKTWTGFPYAFWFVLDNQSSQYRLWGRIY